MHFLHFATVKCMHHHVHVIVYSNTSGDPQHIGMCSVQWGDIIKWVKSRYFGLLGWGKSDNSENSIACIS